MREKAAEGRGLYRPEFEHDACGIGAVVDIQGRASHETVDDALKIVEKLEHRAGKDAEGKTGDGVGILTQIPHAFFARAAAEASIALPGRRDYGVGMFFLPRDGLKRRQAQRQFELVTEKEGMAFLGWREVPVHPEILGQRARDKMPSIFQAFVARPEETAPGLDFDRKLYVARRVFEHLSGDTYVVSLSSRTVVYKGMFLVHQLRAFYPDLQSINYTSALAIVHSRFSTNTNPSWERAHPNRLIAHNGEINTIRGNMVLLTKSRSAPPCQQKKTPTGVIRRILSFASGSMRSPTRGSGLPLPLSLVAKRALSCARASARKTSPRTRPAAASVPLDKQARGCASNCAAGPPQSS